MSSVKRIKVAHDGGKAMTSASHHDVKHIQDLPTDVFQHCLEFVGKGNFAFVAPVSKHFYWNYINLGVEMKNNVIDVDVILQQGRNKRTTAKDVVTGSLRLATECFFNAPKKFQEQVCRQAAVKGRLDILKCAVAFGVDMKESVFPYQYRDDCDYAEVLTKILVNNHLNVIEYLHDQGIVFDDCNIFTYAENRCKGSSLHWMVSKGIIKMDHFRNEVIHHLARDGEIDILKESYEASLDKYSLQACASAGNIGVMYWLMEQNVLNIEWTSGLFASAVKSGSIPIMELCLQNGCPRDESICVSAANNESTEVALAALKWLRENNVPWDERVCAYAAINGNLKALKWAKENGCPWNDETFDSAIVHGNTDILDYCFEHNCPFDHNIVYHFPFDVVLKDISLKVYKWLHQHSIPWDDEAGLITAQHGHLATLMWAVENGCPWHDDILGCAIGQFDFPMVAYCIQHLSPMDGNVYVLAINKMNENREARMNDDLHLEMIKMLQMFHDYGIPWSRDIIPHAERLGRSKVANWLRCVGCPE